MAVRLTASFLKITVVQAFSLYTSVAGPPGPVTYHKHIAPILWQYCAPCHRAGESAPFPLLTYADAKKIPRRIAAVTRQRLMPPWLPEPGYGEFEDERRLSPTQIDLIARWAQAGAPEGDPSDSPPPPVFTPGWQLGTPDLILSAAKPVRVPSDGGDVFWNFILSPSLRETRYVKALEIRPGAAQSIHHANLMVDRARSLRHLEKAPGEGFEGMDLVIQGDAFDPDSHFLFWKPGAPPWVEPDGLAWRLDPGNDLVLNTHLHPTGKPEIAQPSVGLYFTDKAPAKFPMLIQLEHDGALDIPPGAADFPVADDFRLPVDVDVLAVYPHAHYLGKLLEGYATLPDKSRRWLVRILDWNPDWQGVFRYRKPVFLPKGTVVSMRFHYNNSGANPRNPNSPPKRVVGGNQSTDEMAHLWLQVLPRGAGDQRPALQEAVMLHRLEKYPADFSAHFNLGALLLRRKDAAPAIGHLQDALRVQPGQPVALNTLGVALEMEGRRTEAIEQFLHAIRAQPDYTSARYNLANALAAEGRLKEAATNYRQVLAATADDRAAHERLVAVLMEIGTSESYRELVALEPGNADYRNNYGILLARSANVAAAIEQFEAALKINPAHAAARRNLEVARKKAPQN